VGHDGVDKQLPQRTGSWSPTRRTCSTGVWPSTRLA
jgi:hypothetical protein